MKDGCQELSGVYWYDKIKTIITLNGEVDEDGNFELIEYFDTEKKVRGEIVIIVEGKAIAKKKKKDKYK